MNTIEQHSIKLLHNFHYVVEICDGKVQHQYFKIGLPYYEEPRIIEIEQSADARQYYENMFKFLNECPPAFTREDIENFMNSKKGNQLIPNLSGLYIDNVLYKNNQWVINLSDNTLKGFYLADIGMQRMSVGGNNCCIDKFPCEETIELSDGEVELVQHYVRIYLFKALLDYPYNKINAPIAIPHSPFILDIAQAQGWIK